MPVSKRLLMSRDYIFFERNIANNQCYVNTRFTYLFQEIIIISSTVKNLEDY